MSEKPPLTPLDSSEDEEEELLAKRAKRKKQMAQSAKVQVLTNYLYIPKNAENIGLTWLLGRLSTQNLQRFPQ